LYYGIAKNNSGAQGKYGDDQKNNFLFHKTPPGISGSELGTEADRNKPKEWCF
jgi:hypothetical protein